MSRRPEDVLAQYRAAQSLGDADRARLFEAVAERLAKGGAVDPKASGAHASVSGASAKVIALGAKIVLGLALAGASSAAWFATRGPVGHDAPVTQMAPPAAFATATPGADWHPIAAQVTVPAPEPTQARGAARTPEVAEVDSGFRRRAERSAGRGARRPRLRSRFPGDHAACRSCASGLLRAVRPRRRRSDRGRRGCRAAGARSRDRDLSSGRCVSRERARRSRGAGLGALLAGGVDRLECRGRAEPSQRAREPAGRGRVTRELGGGRRGGSPDRPRVRVAPRRQPVEGPRRARRARAPVPQRQARRDTARHADPRALRRAPHVRGGGRARSLPLPLSALAVLQPGARRVRRRRPPIASHTGSGCTRSGDR